LHHVTLLGPWWEEVSPPDYLREAPLLADLRSSCIMLQVLYRVFPPPILCLYLFLASRISRRMLIHLEWRPWQRDSLRRSPHVQEWEDSNHDAGLPVGRGNRLVSIVIHVTWNSRLSSGLLLGVWEFLSREEFRNVVGLYQA
jgi:hypothetical protein